MAFTSKKSSFKEQDKASKDTHLLIHFTVQCLHVLENSFYKSKMSHRRGEGSEKCPKVSRII